MAERRPAAPACAEAAFEAIRSDAAALRDFAASSSGLSALAERKTSELYRRGVWNGPVTRDVLYSYELQGRLIARAEQVAVEWFASDPGYFADLKPWHSRFITAVSHLYAPVADEGIILTCTGASLQRSVMRFEYSIAHPRRSHALVDLEPGAKMGESPRLRPLRVLTDEGMAREVERRLAFLDEIAEAEREGDRALRILYARSGGAVMAPDDPVHERLYRATRRLQNGAAYLDPPRHQI